MLSDVVQETVRFFTSPGYELAGVLFRPPKTGPKAQPSGGDGPGGAPGVVLVQGFGGFKEGTPPTLAAHLARNGYVVLTFDFRGFGESEGPRGRLDPFGQVQDIRDGLTFLQQVDGVDGGRIALYGTSFGGGLVTYTAAVEPRAKAVVATVPVTHGELWLRSLRRHWEFEALLDELDQDRRERVRTGVSRLVEKYHIMVPDPQTEAYYADVVRKQPSLAHAQITLESVDRIMEFRPVDVAHRIAPRPLLIIAAERDILVKPDQATSLYEHAAEPKRLVVMPGVNHFTVYSSPVREQVMDLAVEWFDTHMPVIGEQP